MTQVVLDALSHQAIRHTGSEQQAYGTPPDKAGLWKGERLKGAISALGAAGHDLMVARPDAAALAGADALIVASRSQLFPFTTEEIDAIRGFVDSGGGLWLMANHRLFVQPQQQLAVALGLPAQFNDITVGHFPKVRVHPHLLTAGCSELVVRNASSIAPLPGAMTLASYAADQRHCFAVAAAPPATNLGRVVMTADSGFIASRDDAGQRMFESGDNARLFANVINWLTARTDLVTAPKHA